jgi:hypothetical protein
MPAPAWFRRKWFWVALAVANAVAAFYFARVPAWGWCAVIAAATAMACMACARECRPAPLPLDS